MVNSKIGFRFVLWVDNLPDFCKRVAVGGD